MSCKYCENYDKNPDDWKPGDIIIVEQQSYTYVGDGFPYPVPMRYCQNCGDKLIKPKESPS